MEGHRRAGERKRRLGGYKGLGKLVGEGQGALEE